MPRPSRPSLSTSTGMPGVMREVNSVRTSNAISIARSFVTTRTSSKRTVVAG